MLFPRVLMAINGWTMSSIGIMERQKFALLERVVNLIFKWV